MPTFPFITLLISGGHTLIVLVLGPQRFRVLATTVDQAVGNVIDVAARAVRVNWQGRAPGAALEALARDGLPGVEEEDIPSIPPPAKPFPGQLRWSFAGLQSWVNTYVVTHGHPANSLTEEEIKLREQARSMKFGRPDPTRPHKVLRLTDPHRIALARTVQDAAFSQLEDKLVLALKWCQQNRESIIKDIGTDSAGLSEPHSDLVVRHVVVSGGVASNLTFRTRYVIGHAWC